MSGTTFSTYPVQSHKTAQTTPASGPGTDHAASLEKSYLSASSQSRAAPQSSTYAQHGAGPGLTTLAVGEEDGGGMAMPAANGPMSTPQTEGGLQVTTLAIGEEDGGGYGTMQPIRDDHSVIGGASVGNTLPPVMEPGATESYGRMQPIYSPGEAEYPAFAQTSQTPDLLNFHPVARVPKTAIAPPAPATTAPVTIAAPVAAQPITMATTPVGMQTEAVPQSGSYQTVGSYEDYLGGVSSQAAAPAPSAQAPSASTPSAPTMTYQPAPPAPVDTGAVYEPVDVAPSQPVYETYQPVAETSVYDSMRVATPPPPAEAAPTYVETQPVAPPPPTVEYAAPAAAPEYAAPPPAAEYSAPAPAPEYVAPAPAPAPEYVAPAAPVTANAPMTSVEPQQKPELFVKDAPFDYNSTVEPADPADGNPGYVAPVEAVKESAPAAEIVGPQPAESQAAEPQATQSRAAEPQTASPAPAAVTAEASYVSVPIDAYLVDPAATDTAAATPDPSPAEASPATDAPVAAASTADAPVAAAPVAAPAEPAPTQMAEPKQTAEPAEQMSLGGSYKVIDGPLPNSLTGVSSGAGTAGPSATQAAPPDASINGLQIMTLSVGEESGAP